LTNDDTWVFQSASFVKDFFGEDSTEYNWISQFEFRTLVSSAWSTEQRSAAINDKPRQAKQFLNDCIETLKIKGLYKPKSNFLQRLDNSTLWTIIAFAIPSILGLGFFFGNLKYDKDKLEAEQTIKQLKDSLVIIKSSIPIIIPTDSTSQQKSSDNKTANTINK